MTEQEQKFYFPEYPLSYEIALIVVETELRVNNLGNKCVVKLPKGSQQEYPQLEGLTCYSHKEALEILEGEEWHPIIEF